MSIHSRSVLFTFCSEDCISSTPLRERKTIFAYSFICSLHFSNSAVLLNLTIIGHRKEFKLILRLVNDTSQC